MPSSRQSDCRSNPRSGAQKKRFPGRPMVGESNINPRLAFDGVGLRAAVAAIKEEIRELYLDDAVPWVVGYSGGKDSTAVLQLMWLALLELPSAKRTKPIHVISTDTLVENPIVASWVNKSLDVMREA